MSLPDHLSTLESVGLIRLAQLEPDLEYLFRHALVQDAAYDSLLSADQKQLHLAVGAAIEELYPDQLEQHAAMLARHFEKGGQDQQAHKYFALAGKASLASYANQEAESQFRSALALSCCESERAALLDGLGEALYRQSRFADAMQAWMEAINLYRSLKDTNSVARLYGRSARVAWHKGDTPESLKLSREGLAVVDGAPDSPGLALLVHEAARACLLNGLPEEALPLCRQALKMAERLCAMDVQADALATLGVLPDLPPEEVLGALEKAVELAEAHGLLQIAVRAHHNLGVMISGLQGDQRAARHHYLRAAEIARQRGVVSEELFSYVNAAEVSLGLGNLSEVGEMLQDLDRLLKAIADPAPFILAIDNIRSRLLWLLGEWDQALHLSRICQKETRQRGDLQRLYDLDAYFVSELLELHQYGELEELEEIEIVLSEAIEIGERGLGGRVWPYCWMSILRSRQGRFQDSAHWLSEARDAANAQPSFWNDIALVSADVELAVAQKHWPQALAGVEALAAKYSRIEAHWDWASTLKDWAEILILRAEPADLPRAQALLSEALALFDEMGATRHASLLRDRLQTLKADLHTRFQAYQKDAQELAQARRIQASFLPKEIPALPGWQLAASLTPARETSGDFYDFISFPDGRLGIVIADVADKGAAAALYMASGRTLIHTFALEYPNLPELVIGEANRRIMLDTHEGLFITVFYAVLDPTTGKLTYCNAGHNPPLLLRPQGDPGFETLTRTGIPLGIVEKTAWEQRTLQLIPGQVLILYTDGVIDAQNGQGAFFGDERLLASVGSNLGGDAQSIHDAIRIDLQKFTSGAPQFDDITLVVLVRDAD